MAKFPVCPECGCSDIYKMNVCAVWDFDTQDWKMVTREPDDLRYEDEYCCAQCHPDPEMGSMGGVVWRKV